MLKLGAPLLQNKQEEKISAVHLLRQYPGLLFLNRVLLVRCRLRSLTHSVLRKCRPKTIPTKPPPSRLSDLRPVRPKGSLPLT